MKKNIFISGSITITKLPTKVCLVLDKLINEQYYILVGDAKGVDLLIQQYFYHKNYKDVQVYHLLGEDPRNNVGNFTTKAIDYTQTKKYQKLEDKEKEKIDKFDGRSRQSFKDEAMNEDADFILCVWDGKSKGTKNNIIRAIEKMQKDNIDIESHLQVYCCFDDAKESVFLTNDKKKQRGNRTSL